jgi:hypothetical protein
MVNLVTERISLENLGEGMPAMRANRLHECNGSISIYWYAMAGDQQAAQHGARGQTPPNENFPSHIWYNLLQYSDRESQSTLCLDG